MFIIPKNSGLEKCAEIAEKYSSAAKIIKIRGEDVPALVLKIAEKGMKVIGITGEDLFTEYQLKNKSPLEVRERVEWNNKDFIFGKPTLCLLGPKYKSLKNLPKKLKVCINAKYKNLAENFCKEYLEEKGYATEKIYVQGATEEFFIPSAVDMVIDIVCSGKSAEKAGLKIYKKIFSSNIVVIKPNRTFTEDLDFKKMKLVPTIVKDQQGNILMLAYSSQESLKKALETKKGWYFSRSRRKLWRKGETSGNTQEIIDIKTDCDKDALLFTVKQKGVGCHLGRYSCFEEEKIFDLRELFNIINERIRYPKKNSYTKKLILDAELLKRKIVEEAAEVITAKNKEELVLEFADIFYFLLVYMAKNSITLGDIYQENTKRDKKKQTENSRNVFKYAKDVYINKKEGKSK